MQWEHPLNCMKSHPSALASCRTKRLRWYITSALHSDARPYNLSRTSSCVSFVNKRMFVQNCPSRRCMHRDQATPTMTAIVAAFFHACHQRAHNCISIHGCGAFFPSRRVSERSSERSSRSHRSRIGYQREEQVWTHCPSRRMFGWTRGHGDRIARSRGTCQRSVEQWLDAASFRMFHGTCGHSNRIDRSRGGHSRTDG